MADKQQTKAWYVRRGGKVKGPIPVDLIRRYYEARQLQADDEVSPDGERWRRIGDIPALASAPTPPPPAAGAADGANAEQEALRWELERRKAQQRAELRGRAHRGDGSLRVRPWHYAVVAVLIAAIAALPWLMPEGETITEPQCDAPPAAGVVWRDCRLIGREAANADLAGADMRGANLSGSVFRAANLTAADASYANLSQSSLRGGNLGQATLVGANLQRSDLSHANFGGANLSYADLTAADVTSADFTGARLDNAIWTDGRVCAPGSLGRCAAAARQP